MKWFLKLMEIVMVAGIFTIVFIILLLAKQICFDLLGHL